jgi:hypothetical protein
VTADVERLHVDLQERLAIGVEQLGILEAGVGRRQARADHEHGVGGRDHLVGHGLPPVPEDSECQAMHVGDRALSGRRRRHRDREELGQLGQLRPGS